MDIDTILDAERGNLLEFTREMIGVNSQIPPYGDERAIVDLVRERANDLGLGKGEIHTFAENRPNLVIRIPGTGHGRTLMLNGHVDTKPVGDAGALWRTDPFGASIVDGKLYGLGASDMKAAVAAMLYAAHALVRSDSLTGGDLVLAFVADEEAGANYGSKLLAPAIASQVDACLVGEPSGWEYDWQGIHLVSRGLCCFRIKVRGTQMHSSLSDRMPSVNANQKLAELLLRLPRELVLDHPEHPLGARPTLNAGVTVQGGVFYGVVPGEAEFGCDLRTVPGMSRESVDNALNNWLAEVRQSDPDMDVELAYEPSLAWISPAEISPEHALVAATTRAAAEVLGQAPPLSVFPGTTDAPWFAEAGIPTLPSFGPGILTYCHGPNEFVSVESIHQAARIYARTAAYFR